MKDVLASHESVKQAAFPRQAVVLGDQIQNCIEAIAYCWSYVIFGESKYFEEQAESGFLAFFFLSRYITLALACQDPLN